MHAMATDLRDKVAIVTGGAGGLGTATCRALAAAGAIVVVADLDEVNGTKLAHELDGRFVRLDVTTMEANEALVAETLDAYGRLDLVHLNAGIASGCGIGDLFALERYRRAMAANLDGVVFGTQAPLPALQRN